MIIPTTRCTRLGRIAKVLVNGDNRFVPEGTVRMDYEKEARKLVVYSRSLARGSLNSVQGLSVGESPVLHYLSTKEDGASTTPSDLAAQLGFTRARMTRILDSFAAKGLVRREQDENDKRRVLVFITDEGRKHALKQNAKGVNAMKDLIEMLGEQDTKELIRILQKGYKNTYGEHSPDDLDS